MGLHRTTRSAACCIQDAVRLAMSHDTTRPRVFYTGSARFCTWGSAQLGSPALQETTSLPLGEALSRQKPTAQVPTLQQNLPGSN